MSICEYCGKQLQYGRHCPINIALADWVREHKGYSNGFNQATIDSLANFCQSQNGNFKRDRWIAYINGECGKNGGKVK